jgi:hypothetical protein
MTYADALDRIARAEPFALRQGETVTDPPQYAAALRWRLDAPRTAERAQQDLKLALESLDALASHA